MCSEMSSSNTKLPSSAPEKVPAVRRIVVISDTQLPYENRRQVTSLLRFIGDTQPDEIVHVGDVMDFPQPSRWNKTTRGEFEGSVRRDAQDGRKFPASLRDVHSGPVGVTREIMMSGQGCTSRSTAPPWTYSPTHSGSTSYWILTASASPLLPDFYPFAPGWVSTHGHLGFSLSRIAGNTALNAAKKVGNSLVMGHTHRAGIVSESSGYGGKLQTVTGMEVGNLMSMAKATYLKSGAANWQSGFAVITIAGRCVTPELVPMQPDGAFAYAGRRWS